MNKVKGENNVQHNQENIKKLKSNLSFWSPLNDNFNPPDKKSTCTWHKNVDRLTTPHTTKDWRRTSKTLPNALAAIGNTPLIKLNKIPQAEGLKCDVYVKCEYFNPGGSVKDRIGARLIEDAEKQGLLKPGYTIIEPSSGNTGIGLAMAAAIKGYRCIIVMSEKMSNEKVSVLSALGAEIVRTPVNADSNSAEGMFGTTYKLRKEIPNSVILDQYSNPGNPLAHYDTTAEEIYEQCDKNVDMIIIGAGTGGTVTGIGRKFKEISPHTKIVGADPLGSVLALPDSLNRTETDFYEVEGIGYDFVPTVLDRSVVDLWIKTNDQESLPMARRLIKEEGLLVGSSSGAALVAAVKAAKHLEAGKKVVVILPDSIRNYITKFASDQWMEARNLMTPLNTLNHWWWDKNVTTLDLEPLKVATTSMTCEKVLNLITKAKLDQIPVVDGVGGMVGMLTSQFLMEKLLTGRIQSNESVEKCIVRIYPKVQKTVNLGVVSRILEKEPYVLVLDKQGEVEKPLGIVKPLNLLQYIQKKE
ncbi:unnamed protein product [Psylliodes chrysocephalus]|uniref:Cystathionine beta-synthase n=1 Tax=Psylliodes chrysocephalus TaxID=3402493 RepID=A0A9P0D205_9CUCU|nr:unnamed protein product [Psylliodes chrysocephala]